MTATMHGLTTIRAFSAEKMVIQEFDDLQDRHSSAWFLFMSASRCFGLWLDLICITFIAIAVFGLLTFSGSKYIYIILFKEDHINYILIFKTLYYLSEIQGGDLGLVITQYIGLIGSLQWGMRQWSELENQMTSVERVLEYTKLESEPVREEKPLPLNWPERGHIQFKDVKLRYSENDPYVLKSLSFKVLPKEKIGIVGRTGAGKSSTISALFQLYKLEGSILIDEIDTTDVPLEDVRTKISIIPQEPVLFSGKYLFKIWNTRLCFIFFQEQCAKIWILSKNIVMTFYGML